MIRKGKVGEIDNQLLIITIITVIKNDKIDED